MRRPGQKARWLYMLPLVLALFAMLPANAQQVCNTPITDNASAGVTFNVTNANAYDVEINSLDCQVDFTTSPTAELWYKAGAISVAPGTINGANGWTSSGAQLYAATAGVLATAVSGINITIPAGTTMGMYIGITGANIQYYNALATTTTTTVAGVTLEVGGNAGYGGGVAGPAFNPRGFIGCVDFQPVDCSAPTAVNATGVTTTAATINFTPTVGTGTYIVEYGAPGFIPGNTPAAGGGTVAAGAGSPIGISGLTSGTTYDVYVREDCGAGPGLANSVLYRFNTTCVTASLPYTQNFNSAVPPALPPCITPLDANGGGNTWISATAPAGFAGRVARYNSEAVIANDWFFTNAFNVTIGNSYTVTFLYGNDNAGFTENLEVGHGVNPTPGSMVVVAANQYAVNSGAGVANSSSLTFVATATGIHYIGFHAYSPASQGALFVDNVFIAPTSACPSVTALGVGNVEMTTADVSFTCTSCTGSFIAEYGAPGFTPGSGAAAGASGTVVTGGSSPIMLTGLTTETDYDVYVRQNCGAGPGISFNTGPQSFTTLCAALNIPYSEDFATAPSPAFPSCMLVEDLGSATSWGTGLVANGFADNSAFIQWDVAAPMNDWFYTQALNLTGGTSYRLQFNYGALFGTFTESLEVYYGAGHTAAGMTDLIVNYPTVTGAGVQASTSDFTPAVSGVYYIGFHGYSIANQENLVVDDILVTLTPSCEPVTGLTSFSTGTNSAEVGWNCAGCTGTFAMEYGPSGFIPGTGTPVAPVDSGDGLAGLMSATLYDVYVWQDCGIDGLSDTLTSSFMTDAGCGDVWQDNGGAGVYSNNANDTVTFCANPGEELTVLFSSFDVEAGWDALYVYDGATTADPIIPSGEAINSAGFPADGWSSASGAPGGGSVSASALGGCLTFVFLSDASGQFAGWDAQISCATCAAPEDVAVSNISDISADVSWNCTSPLCTGTFNMEYDTAGFTPGTGNFIVGATSIQAIGGLVPETDYDVYVWQVCSPTDSSDAVLVSFTSAPACASATSVAASNVTASSADISWTCVGACITDFILEWDTAGFAPGTGTNINPATSPTLLGGLDASTTYDVYIWQDCGGDTVLISFTTNPGCGDNWYDSGGAAGVYANNENDSITLCADPGTLLNVDFSSFDVEGGWDALYVYDGPSSASPIIPSGEAVNDAGFPADGWSNDSGAPGGGTVSSSTLGGCLTFVFRSDASGQFGGWDALLNCITCSAPEDVAATNVTATMADITWNCTTPLCGGTFTLEWDTAGFAPGTGNMVAGATSPETIMGLDSLTSYDVYVWQDCGSDTSFVNFTTPDACAPVTVLTPTSITADSVEVTWTCAGCTGTLVVEWDTTGFALGTGNMIPSAASPLGIGGLTPGDTYDLYIWQDCGGGTMSDTVQTTFTMPFGCGDAFLDNGGAGVYANNSDDVITYCADPGSLLSVDFSSFVVEAGWDALYVYDGPTTASPIIPSGEGINSAGFPANGWSNNSGAPGGGSVSSSTVGGCLTFRFRSDASGQFDGWDALANCATCSAPEAVAIGNITTDTAEVSWTCTTPLCAGTFDLEYGVSGFTPGTGTSHTGVTSPFVLDTLTDNTTYDVYIWQDCGGGDLSDSVLVSFTTVANCLAVTSLGGSAVSDSEIEVVWTCVNCLGPFSMEYGPTGFTQGTGTVIMPADSGDTVAGLMAGTDYDFYVWQDCGSDTVGTTITTLPGCGSAWYDNGGPTGDYANNSNDTITFCADPGQLLNVSFSSFDVEGGWDALYVYDGATTASPIIPSGEPVNDAGFPANGWSNDSGAPGGGSVASSALGGCLTFVFRSDGSVPFPGWEAMINCVSCAAPEDVAVGSISSISADVSWNCSFPAICAGTFMLEYDTAGFAPGTGTTIVAVSPQAIAGLDPETDYDVYVWQDCGGGDMSDSVLVSFTTSASCAPVTSLAASNIGGNTADVSWDCFGCTGTFVMEYGTAGFAMGTGTVVNPASSPASLMGLMSQTTYDVYVYQDCGGGTLSDTTLVSFTTSLGCGDDWYDTGGPGGNYANNEDEVNTFCAPAGQFMSVSFNSFDVEAGWDAMYVYDGPTTASPLIPGAGAPNVTTGFPAGSWDNGTGAPGGGSISPSALGGCLTFRFRSDASGPFAGWDASIGCFEPNFDCASADTITCFQTLSGVVTTTNSLPASACPFNGAASTGGTWYLYQALADEYVNVSTCNATSFDSRISIFEGAPDCSSLACVAMNDDGFGCASGSSDLNFAATNGTNYYIVVHGAGGSTGSFDLTVNCNPICAPAAGNTNCGTATALASGLSGTGTPSAEDNTCAYIDAPTSCSGTESVQGLWYTFNSGISTRYELTLLTNAQDGAYSSTLMSYALYSGTCSGLGAGGEIACVAAGEGTTLLPLLTAGVDYTLVVYNRGGIGVEGSFGLLLEFLPDYDAGISSILAPGASICGTEFEPVVILNNYGSIDLTSVDILWDIDGGTPMVYNWTGFLGFNQSTGVALPITTTPPGVHDLNVYTSNPNGNVDQQLTNDTATVNYNSDGEQVQVHIISDGAGNETTWSIFDSFFAPVASGGPYPNNVDVTEAHCLSTANGTCYTMQIFDSMGDGMCCTNGMGSWEVLDGFGRVIIKDDGQFAAQSPALAPANASYFAHEFCLPLGPSTPEASECGVFTNTLLNKVYATPIAGALNYQFEFSDPNAGFYRRIAVPRNWVRFSEMQTVPLVAGTTYFCRVRVDQGFVGSFFDDNWGPGCEMGLDPAQVPGCTSLIDNVALPTHSCGSIKEFGGSDRIWAIPVVGANSYRFSFSNPSEGFLRNIARPNYVCVLNWVTLPLTSGTYDVSVEVLVNGTWSGFCGPVCQVTIVTPASAADGDQANTDTQILMFPNPNRGDQVQLMVSELQGEKQQILVDVYDMFGKRIQTNQFENRGQVFHTELDFENELAAGSYLIKLTVDGRSFQQMLMVQ